MTTELKPCPFCGSDSHIGYLWSRTDGVIEYHVNCAKCSARKEGFPTKESAYAAWNARTPEASKADAGEVVTVDNLTEKIEEEVLAECQFHGTFDAKRIAKDVAPKIVRIVKGGG
jgi:Lar family restriction alleviation protein